MTKELSKIEQLSQERKQSVIDGWNPDWVNTPGYQLLKSSYFTEDAPNLKLTFNRIAKVLSKHASKKISEQNDWKNRFFRKMWKGDLIPSTPVISSCGTDKGLVVSCCANYVDDSVKGFYDATSEMAVLSQEGFGTASYLGDIRPRGSVISRGGKASGVLPVIQQFVQMARDITQGTRRGAWAGYLPIEHGDFLEVVNYLEHNPEDLNLGWLISDSFIEKLKQDDPDALLRYKRALKVKLVTGKGYFVFNDKANRALPQFMKDQGLEFNGSQLCITGDSIVTIADSSDGTNSRDISILDLETVYSNGMFVLSYENGQKVFKSFEGVIDKGLTDELYEIEANGCVCRCTPDHKILTERGMVAAMDLIETDIIITM